MKDKLVLNRVPENHIKSSYVWFNIEYQGCRVGKLRGQIKGAVFVINSINVFSGYEGMGIATQIIDVLKSQYHKIIADRVRYTAKGFWCKMGFKRCSRDSYAYDVKDKQFLSGVR